MDEWTNEAKENTPLEDEEKKKVSTQQQKRMLFLNRKQPILPLNAPSVSPPYHFGFLALSSEREEPLQALLHTPSSHYYDTECFLYYMTSYHHITFTRVRHFHAEATDTRC